MGVSTNIFPFGVWGGEASYSANAAKAHDLNTDTAVKRYSIVMINNPTSSDLPIGNVQYTATVQAFASDNGDFETPTNAKEAGLRLVAGAALVLASLY